MIAQEEKKLQLPPRLGAMLGEKLTRAVSLCRAPWIEEIRLYCNRFASVTAGGRQYPTSYICTREELNGLLRTLCGGSLYAYSQSINQGFVTVGDGIRVGICGRAATEDGRIIGISDVSGMVIRVPHPLSVSPAPLLEPLIHGSGTGGVLLYAPPGAGKTTLLRAAAKEAASPRYGICTVAVDTREELCYGLDGQDLNLNILIGYPRNVGICIAVRTLGARLIVCDEIGDRADADAILEAANCGVPLIASAHAARVEELLLRPAISMLHRAHVFDTYVGMKRTAGNRYAFRTTGWREAERALTGGTG